MIPSYNFIPLTTFSDAPNFCAHPKDKRIVVFNQPRILTYFNDYIHQNAHVVKCTACGEIIERREN